MTHKGHAIPPPLPSPTSRSAPLPEEPPSGAHTSDSSTHTHRHRPHLLICSGLETPFYPQVLELEPSFAEAHLCLADVYSSSGKPEQASASMAAAAQLRPEIAGWVSTQRAGGASGGRGGEGGGDGRPEAGEGGAEGGAGGDATQRLRDP